MAKAGPNSGKRRGANAGSGRPSSFSLWLLGGILAAAAAWWSLRKEVGSRPRETEEADGRSQEERYVDERLEFVRSALLDGKPGKGGDRSGGVLKSRFSEAEYWEERYTKTQKEHYDWYGTWNSPTAVRIKPYVSPWLPAGGVGSVLNLGCGNSRLPEELSNDGFKDVVSVDISHAAIDKMRTKFAERSEMRWMQMDITKMSFPDESFDLVFDKGTFDALYTGSSDLVLKAVPEVFRVLKPGGLFVSMTFGAPKSRRELNATGAGAVSGWEVFRTVLIDRKADATAANDFYIYGMTKPLKKKP